MRLQALFGFAVASILCLSCSTNNVPPEEAGKQYMKELGYRNAGVSCTQTADAGGNPWAHCTVSLDRGSDLSPLLIVLKCAPLGESTGGCWMPQEQMNALMTTKIVLQKNAKE